MILYIKTQAVYVTDQKRAQDFYTRQLGFEVRKNLPMEPNANWIEVAPPGAQSCLVLYPRAMMRGWEQMKPSIVFKVADMAATVKELSGRGVEFVEKPKDMPWGIYAKIADPDHNEFLLVQDK